MSVDQDLLAQVLRRVICEPAVGAGVDTNVVALADNMGAGVAARSLLATVGKATDVSSDVRAMAESNLFEFDAATRTFGSDVWGIQPPTSSEEPVRYVADWGELGLKVGDFAIFSEQMHVSEVMSIENTAVAGTSYAKLEFASDPGLESDGEIAMVTSQRAGASSLYESPVSFSHGRIILDGVYPGMKRGDLVLIEYKGEYLVRTLEESCVVQIKLDVEKVGFEGSAGDAYIPATRVKLDTQITSAWKEYDNYVIHYNLVRAGRVFHAPADTITASAFDSGSAVTGPGVGPQGKYAIVGANGKAAIFEGAVLSTGAELRFLATNFLQGDASYKLPAKLYGPLVEATRGETVKAEVLGSGDATIPFQSFTLRKSPLTYLADPSAVNGRRSTLSVSINGKNWRQAQSFYGATAKDQIYVVTHDADDGTTITFGDGEFGARLPTGVDNVVASYRHGVGGNVEANAINTFKKPVKGISKVFNPLPSSGGEDPPTAAEAREKGIQSTRVLGRLVSLLDFEVEAARYGGVMQARASWAWDARGDDAAVHVWVITADDGDPSEALRCYLLGLAEPDAQVVVKHAKPLVGAFELDLELDPAYQPAAVSKAVLEHLFHPFDGFFALRNVGIGGYLHRSRLYAAIHAVDGVLGVNDVMVNKASMPMAIRIDDGHYVDLLDEPISVNGVLFSANVDGLVTILPANLSLPVPPPEIVEFAVAWVDYQWVPAQKNASSKEVAPGKGPLVVNLVNVQITQPYTPLGMLE